MAGALPGLYGLALGGTAVGTGLNAHKGFGELAIKRLAELTGLPYVPAPNKFAALGAQTPWSWPAPVKDPGRFAYTKSPTTSGWLGSGPRAGLDELDLPANEPGSPSCRARSTPPSARPSPWLLCRSWGTIRRWPWPEPAVSWS